MSLSFLDNVDYRGKKSNFSRDLHETLLDLKNFSENYLPDIFIACVKETGKLYIFNRNNVVTDELGKWREFTGNGDTNLIETLSINGTALTIDNKDIDLTQYVITEWQSDVEVKEKQIVLNNGKFYRAKADVTQTVFDETAYDLVGGTESNYAIVDKYSELPISNPKDMYFFVKTDETISTDEYKSGIYIYDSTTDTYTRYRDEEVVHANRETLDKLSSEINLDDSTDKLKYNSDIIAFLSDIKSHGDANIYLYKTDVEYDENDIVVDIENGVIYKAIQHTTNTAEISDGDFVLLYDEYHKHIEYTDEEILEMFEITEEEFEESRKLIRDDIKTSQTTYSSEKIDGVIKDVIDKINNIYDLTQGMEYLTFDTKADLDAEDLSTYTEGIYLLLVRQNELYPRDGIDGLYYTTIYIMIPNKENPALNSLGEPILMNISERLIAHSIENAIKDAILIKDEEGNYTDIPKFIARSEADVPTLSKLSTLKETDENGVESEILLFGGKPLGNGSGELIESITSNVDVGGVESGTTFEEGTSMEEMLRAILVKYFAPTITLTSSVTKLTQKIGTTLSNVKLTATTTKKTNPITKVVIEGTEVSGDVSNGGSYNKTITSINDTTTFVATVTDGKKQSEAKLTYTFIHPYYYGALNKNTIDSDTDLTSLTELVEIKGTKTLSYTANEKYLFFAMPKSYTALTSIKDQNTFDNTNSFNVINYTDGDGVEYRVYVSKNKITCSLFKYTFA